MDQKRSQKFCSISQEMLERKAKGEKIKDIVTAMGFKSVSAYYHYTKDKKIKTLAKGELIECLIKIKRLAQETNNVQIIHMINILME